MATIDTKTARRRMVAFASLADLSNDLAKIEAAHASRTLRMLGNHAPGSICHHLALPMKASFDGFPAVGSLWLRIMGRLLKKWLLSRPFRPGLMLARNVESMVWDESLPLEVGLKELREQIARAAAPRAAPSVPHPFFGAMSPAEWQVYYLRHAELHLSFLQPLPDRIAR